MRLAKIQEARKEQQEAHKSWIRRNKHSIKLKSIKNRGLQNNSEQVMAGQSNSLDRVEDDNDS